MTFPCRGCTDRVLGCHSACMKYKEAQEQQEKKSQALKKAKREYDFDYERHDMLRRRIK